VLDDAKQSLRFDRLAHNCGRPGFPGSWRNIGTSRHYHDRNSGNPSIFAALGKEAPAIQYRHRQIQKNYRRTRLRVGNHPKCLTSIRRALDGVTLERKEFRERLA